MSKVSVETPSNEQATVDYTEIENREISKNYRIVAKQGSGGCSVVYDAWRVDDGRHVAIKVLSLPEDLQKSEAELTKKRFYREARILSALKNEHSVHCFEYGLFSGAPCVVLEFVEGQQLDMFLRDFGALPFEYGVDIVCQVLEALEESHALGIIHRDIKPANIMVIQDSEPPVVRLIDFGIATLLEGALGELMKTKLGVVRGTPSYMAPELFSGTTSASPESDIYAVGLVLCEIITGMIAVTGSSLVQIAFKQAHEPLDVPKNIPECLARVIRKCCEKDPSDRYHNAREVINELREVLPEAIKQRAKCEADYLQSIREKNSGNNFNVITGQGLAINTGLQLPVNTGLGIQPVIVQNNNKSVTILVILLIVLVALGFGFYFVMRDQGSGNSAGTDSVSAAEAEIAKAKAEAEIAKAKAEAETAKAEAARTAEAARAAKAEADAARAAEAIKAAENAKAAAEAQAADAAAKAAEAARAAEAAKNVAASDATKPTKKPRPAQQTAKPAETQPTPSTTTKKEKKSTDTTNIPLGIF